MTEVMNKATLVAAIAEKAGLDKKAAGSALDGLVEVIREELAAGRVLTIPGALKILRKDTPERQMRNPSTGETFTKPAGHAVKISALKALKDVVG